MTLVIFRLAHHIACVQKLITLASAVLQKKDIIGATKKLNG